MGFYGIHKEGRPLMGKAIWRSIKAALRFVWSLVEYIAIAFIVVALVILIPTVFIVLTVVAAVCRLLSYTGVGFSRQRNGFLQLPVEYYRHPESGRRVVLMGVIHMARPEYYQALQQLIDQMKDYKVLYELVDKLTPEQNASLTQKERAVYLTQFQGGRKERQMLASVLMLQNQIDGLRYDESWVRTDMNLHDIIQMCAEEGLTLFKGGSVLVEDFKSPKMAEGVRWVFNLGLRNMLFLEVLRYVLSRFSYSMRRHMYIILNMRNQIGFDGIQTHSQSQDVVSIWGAAHLPGLGSMLRAEGYVREKRIWLSAYRIKLIPFWSGVRSMADAAPDKTPKVANDKVLTSV